jgi:outer membrane protein OmpA-like peptidoglycan-associated protein
VNSSSQGFNLHLTVFQKTGLQARCDQLWKPKKVHPKITMNQHSSQPLGTYFNPLQHTPERTAEHTPQTACRLACGLFCIVACLSFFATLTLPSIPLPLHAQDLYQSADVRIVNPGAPLNFAGVDYAPAISVDGKTLFFVSNRAGSRKTPKGAFSHDFWAATKQTRLDTLFSLPLNLDTLARTLDNGLNTGFNEGVPSISANRRTMFFTGCNRPDVFRKKKKVDGYDQDYECDIYTVEIQPDGSWGVPRNLGADVNSEDWDGHPSLSPSGDRLYFASTRAGGFGDADIWYTDYNAQTRKWQKPKNAGKAVNTPYRDWSPFIAANNRELFFASEGHTPNYGGTDFFVALRDEKDAWTQPRNLGKPINTSENEAFISTPAQRDVLYFSSQRKDIRGAQGDYDVFMAYVPRNSLSIAIPLTGTVVDGCSGAPTTATIVVYNPLTKRQFRDTLDANKHTTFETVINDFDFGSVSAPRDTIAIQVFVENAQQGRLFQELKIIRPKAAANGTQTGTQTGTPSATGTTEIAPLRFQYGGKPEFSATLPPFDKNNKNLTLRDALVRQMESGFRGFAMEEVVSVSVNRILNYVFFEPSSAAIPSRYVLLKSSTDAAAFAEEKLRGETLDKYYHTLNVFGARLKANPKASISVVGCLDDAETKAGGMKSGLSRSRAAAVVGYLKSVWGIADKRMKLIARDLPNIPSNRDDSLGAAENRRVEILCDDWEITKPVVDRSPFVFTSAPALQLAAPALPALPAEANTVSVTVSVKSVAPQAGTPIGLAGLRRRLVITRAGKVWRTFELGSTSASIAWNWKNDAGEYPSGSEPFEIRMMQTDKLGRECASDAQTIPVRRITTEDKRRSASPQQSADKTLERYNLIMFPFDKSDVGSMNARIIKEYVLPRLALSSETMIVGHTDVIGEEQYNRTLSESRGGNARQELVRLAAEKFAGGERARSLDVIRSRGVGEAEPLFDNSLPEGRFYNRTVQVIIETPVSDVKE